MTTQSSAAPEKPLSRELEDVRSKHGLIALAGLVLRDGEVLDIAAVGHRKKGDPTPVLIDDLWHLGSNTKAMTATMIARLVERGVLGWDDQLADLLPGIAGGIHPGYREVTLDHLLSHRAGLAANFPVLSRFSRPPADAQLPGKRLDAITKALKTKPKSRPGTKHLYSNLGYTLAGVIAEQATGLSWEQLMRQELFEPLGIETAGFGAPGSPDQLDQPWGHQSIIGMIKRAKAPGPFADNDLTIGPAGTVHMSLRDWAKFVDEHLRGEAGEGTLLGPESYKRLHRPTLENYAYGWVLDEDFKYAKGSQVLWHNGSNTMWYALMLLFLDHNTAFLFASNDGDIKAADRAMRTAAKHLAKGYLVP